MNNIINATHIGLEHFLNSSGKTITPHLTNSISSEAIDLEEIFPITTEDDLDKFEKKKLYDKQFRFNVVWQINNTYYNTIKY